MACPLNLGHLQPLPSFHPLKTSLWDLGGSYCGYKNSHKWEYEDPETSKRYSSLGFRV